MHRILYLIIGLLIGALSYGLSDGLVAKIVPDIRRAEVLQAFQERDANIITIAKALNQLAQKVEQQKGK
jgi:hypothetical protein